MSRNRLVLPAPEGPSSQRNPPSGMSKREVAQHLGTSLSGMRVDETDLIEPYHPAPARRTAFLLPPRASRRNPELAGAVGTGPPR